MSFASVNFQNIEFNQTLNDICNLFYLSLILFMATLLFNNYHKQAQGYTHLLYLISVHPSFEAKVNQFRSIFGSQIKQDHLIKLGTLYWTFILPDFPALQHKKLAIQMLESVMLDNSKITYTVLTEYLLKMCQNAIQNIQVRSAIGFLQLLKTRITNLTIVNAERPIQRKRIKYSIKLDLYDSETVINQSELLQQYHRQAAKDIYYQQKVYYQQQALVLQPNQVLVTQLKQRATQVIPYGYVCEDFMDQLINNQFEMKNGYRLKCNRKIDVDKLQYWISNNQKVNSLIRDQVVNQQIFKTSGIMTGAHLPELIEPNVQKFRPTARINTRFSHQAYFQKLKDIKVDQNKYFNILSQFYERDEFNIDQITLTRQKLIARRKEHLLGLQGKQTIKKEMKDYQDLGRSLPQEIVKHMLDFHDEVKLQYNIKQLSHLLKAKLQQGKNINAILQKYISQHEAIPYDNQNPFMEDILTYAQKQPLQLLVIGRQKSGKSTLAKAIAKKYNLVYISLESAINKIFERVKFFQQNPPEADQDGNVTGGLTAIEKCILEDLNQGKPAQEQDVLDLLNNQFQAFLTQSRGFILDLPFQYNKFWIETLISNRIYLPKINCRYFTHIIQTEQTEQQWKFFVSGLMQKPEDLNISSTYDRYIISKPKPPVQEGQQQAEQQGDEEKPVPLNPDNLVQIKCKDGHFPLIQHLTQHINPKRYLKVHNSYQNIQQCLAFLQSSLYNIPLAKRIEGAEKELLTVGLQQSKIVRKWSPWGIVDPVQLSNSKLVLGKYQFACQYAGRVFVFQNEKNLNDFINLPRNYLTKKPSLPTNTNICITGPRKSGKKTIANLLSEIYNLKIINFQSILQKVILKQKAFQSHIASNPEKRSSSVHLSESQFKDFSKGNLLNAKDILPIILYQLGINLQKKPQGWGVQKTQEGGQNAQNQQKKPAVKKKPVKKDKNADDDRPKTPPVQDLLLKEIIPQINHFGKLNEIRGYILLNFPNNQEQLNSLKHFNIPIDKMIILADTNEEAPNKILGQRLNDAELEQVALFMAGIAPVKEALGEQACKQIQIDKTPAQIVNKIRQIIDPFYLKADEDAVNRVCADKQEDGDPIPLGFCGQYCPVVLKQGWLTKGKQQFQAGVQGKRFKFSGQKQLAQFKQNPQTYLNKQNTIIPPRIMFMGVRGVGLKTQLLKFNQKYKIPILNLKQSLIQQIQIEKNKRKTQRYYKRGFKKPQFNEEGVEIEDEELNAQSAEFDKRASQIQITRSIYQGINQIFINANFFDVDQEKVSTNLVQLLTEARRLPEVVFMLTSDQGKWIQRNLDKKQIEKQLEEEIQKIRQQKRDKIQQARRIAQQAGEQFQPPADEEQQLPKLEQKIAAKQQTLKAQRQADAAKIQEFAQAFKALNIEVVMVKCQREVKHVTDKIAYSLKPYLEDRVARWQKSNMLPIERHRVPDFIKNFAAKDSRFGKLNPFSLMKNQYSYPLIYNDRIYYLKDEQEREFVIRNPQSLLQNQSVPHDVVVTPIVFVIGKCKTGKTTLSEALSSKLGLVYISLDKIINEFSLDHKDIQISTILNDLKLGKTLSDDNIIKLVQKRVGMADCIANGWILDGIPFNKKQCQTLNKRQIIPNCVFFLKLSQLQIKKKALKNSQESYDFNIQVIHERLDKNRAKLCQVQMYYENKYNNLKYLDGNLSKWGLFESAKKEILAKIKAKKQFTRALALHNAASISDAGFNFNCIVSNLSEYFNYCPISYKLKRQYIRKCIKHNEHLALYNRKIYIFNAEKQLKDFTANPETFISKGPNFHPPQQVQYHHFKHLQNKAQNKGYCMVQLMRKNLSRGNFSYGLVYKQKYFLTATPKNMKLFIRNPTLYEMIKLQDKLPVQFQKKNDLKKIAKKNDCTAFLEHHLSNIMMRSLAQLGYRRPKYPTLGSKESALKFLAISLKATNPNKDDEYRQKFTQKLNRFIKECNYSQQIRDEVDRKSKGKWQTHDEQNLLKLCEQYKQFLKNVQSEERIKYFSDFIR